MVGSSDIIIGRAGASPPSRSTGITSTLRMRMNISPLDNGNGRDVHTSRHRTIYECSCVLTHDNGQCSLYGHRPAMWVSLPINTS